MSKFAVDVSRYPAELVNKDEIEGNVVYSIAHDLTIIEDMKLEARDFITNDGVFLFSVFNRMAAGGAKEVTQVGVMTTLHGHDKLIDRLTAMGGWSTIERGMKLVGKKNVDSYVDALNKRNTLMRLQDQGFDIIKPLPTKTGERSLVQIAENMSCAEVVEFVDSRLSAIGVKAIGNNIVESGALTLGDDFVTHLSNAEGAGVPFAYLGQSMLGESVRFMPNLSNDVLGLMPGTMTLFGAYSGCGKSTFIANLIVSLVMQSGIHVSIVSNESTINDYRTWLLEILLYRFVGYAQCPRRKLITGQFTEGDLNAIHAAQKIWKPFESFVNISVINEMQSDSVERILKQDVLQKGCSVCIVDTFKADSNPQDKASWEQLLMSSRAMANIALKYNVSTIMTAQLALATQNRLWISRDCLAGSKQMIEVAHNVILFRNVTAEMELDPTGEYYLRPFRNEKNEATGKWEEKPMQLDSADAWRVFFVDKTRSGRTASDTGTAILVKFDGDHSSFSEVCRCRPSHKMLATEGR